jgi:hypothetical protein
MYVCVCVYTHRSRRKSTFASFFPLKRLHILFHFQPTFVEERRVTPDALLLLACRLVDPWIRLPGGRLLRPCLRVSSSWPGRARSPTARSRTTSKRRQRRCVRFTRKGGKTAARTGTNAGTTTSPNAGRRRATTGPARGRGR